jgi:hypothetical protein
MFNGNECGEREGKDCLRVSIRKAGEIAEGACDRFHFVITISVQFATRPRAGFNLAPVSQDSDDKPGGNFIRYVASEHRRQFGDQVLANERQLSHDFLVWFANE